MPPFKYRLQPLLDTKLERKEELELAVVQRNKELAAEQRVLGELIVAQEQLKTRLADALRARLQAGLGANGHELVLHAQYLRGLTGDVEAANGAVSAQRLRLGEFQDRAVEARRQLAEAAREVDVLNKHRERLEQRFLRILEQKEAMEQDEIGGIIFSRKRHVYEGSL